MRMLAVLVAISMLTVPFLMVPDVRAASGVIEISSPEELAAIGTGFPSNGHYRLTGDIVFPTAETMDVNVTGTPDGLRLSPDASDVSRVCLNGTVSSGDMVVKESSLRDVNILAIEHDGMLSASVIERDSLFDGAVLEIQTGSNFSRIERQFTGTIDGAGYAIRGIRMVGEASSMFADMRGACVRNLTVDGMFVSMDISDEGGSLRLLTYDRTVSASTVAMHARDTLFERVVSDSSVCSYIYVSASVEQGDPSDTLMMETKCERNSVCGSLTAYSESCRYLSCTVRGDCISSVCSSTVFDTLAGTAELNTDSRDRYNISESVCGGLIGSSDSDSVAFCRIYGDMRSDTEDTVTMTADTDDESVRCDSRAICGGVAGRMANSSVYASETAHMTDADTYNHVNMPGKERSEILSGQIAGDAKGSVCTMTGIVGDTVSGNGGCSSENTSPDTEVPANVFAVTVSWGDGTIAVDGFRPYMKGDGVICTSAGTITPAGSGIVLNPTFDWQTMTYGTMDLSKDTDDEEVSLDAIVLIPALIAAALFAVVAVRSLRR